MEVVPKFWQSAGWKCFWRQVAQGKSWPPKPPAPVVALDLSPRSEPHCRPANRPTGAAEEPRSGDRHSLDGAQFRRFHDPQTPRSRIPRRRTPNHATPSKAEQSSEALLGYPQSAYYCSIVPSDWQLPGTHPCQFTSRGQSLDLPARRFLRHHRIADAPSCLHIINHHFSNR